MMEERSHTNEIEIDAPIEEVWDAITNPKEIRKWFEDVAELEPKEGGIFRYDSEGFSGASTIEIWEPPHRIKIVSPPTAAPGGGGTPEKAAQSFDYVIESRGNRSILRMTHSGIPSDSSWDPYYDATHKGWGEAFVTLRHVVEEKLGPDVEKFTVFGGTDLSVEEVWARAFGSGGVFEHLPNAAADDRFEINTSLGDRWLGKVLHRQDPGSGGHKGGMSTLAVDELGGGLVSVATEPMMGPKNIVSAVITIFDPVHREAADRYRKLVEESLEVELLPN